MKVVFHKDLGGELATVDVKIEESKLKIVGELSLNALIEKLAAVIPGDSALEAMGEELLKSGVAKI